MMSSYWIIGLLQLSAVLAHTYHDNLDRWYQPVARRPVDIVTDVVNDLGVRILQQYTGHGNVAFSPTGVGFVLAALYEGSAGRGCQQISDALGLPRDRDITRIGFRDLHRRLRTYLNADGFLGGLTLNRPNTKLRPEYEEVLRFYGFNLIDVEEDSVNGTTGAPEDTTTESADTESGATTLPSEESSTPAASPASETTLATDSSATDSQELSAPSETTTSSVEIIDTTSAEMDTSNRLTLISTMRTTMLTNRITMTPSEVSTTSRTTVAGATTLSSQTSQTETVSVSTETPPGVSEATTIGLESQTPLTTISPESTTIGETSGATSTTVGNAGEVGTATGQTMPSGVEGTSTETIEQTTMSDSMDNSGVATNVVGSTTSNSMDDGTTANMVNLTTGASPSGTTTVVSITDTMSNDATTVPGTIDAGVTTPASSNVESVSTDSTSINDNTVAMSTGSIDLPNAMLIASTTLPTQSAKDDSSNRIRKRSVRDYRGYFSSYPEEGIWMQDLGIWKVHSTANGEASVRDSTDISFLVNGCDVSSVSASRYIAVLPFAYFPSLHAVALEFPLDDPRYNILLLMPTDRSDAHRLARDLDGKSLRSLRKQLQPTWVRATIPSFMLRGFVTLTTNLQRLGILDVFEPRAADLSPMTPDLGVYARDVQQSIGVNIRNYMKPDRTHSRESSNIVPARRESYRYRSAGNGLFERAGPVPFTALHPFLYFIIDTETSVTLIAGRVDDPLNSRII